MKRTLQIFSYKKMIISEPAYGRQAAYATTKK